MKSSIPRRGRASFRQRHLLIALSVALSGQLYLNLWAEGFRISAAAILYPVLLLTIMRDSHRPVTGLVTGLCVMGLRVLLDLIQGGSWIPSLLAESPGGLFYLCYDMLLCLLVRDRRAVTPIRLWFSLTLCDALSNFLNFSLAAVVSDFFSAPKNAIPPIVLLLLALFRASLALLLLWFGQRYQQLLLHEEHERRYRQLFLMTADLKTELYFLKKDAEDIESVMTHAYQLYEKLEASQASSELTGLALSIARDVHEVKKDNLRIIRGIEEEVAGTYDGEAMALSDLLQILEVSTRQVLGSQRADIGLECHFREDIPVREHYRLLSVLKNLVTNAVEAIQSSSGMGLVQVDCRTDGPSLLLDVTDNGPGISPRNMRLLFNVGFSTKFHPETGAINRGVGLSAVQYIVEDLGGTIQAESEPGRGTCFHITLPLSAVTGGIP